MNIRPIRTEDDLTWALAEVEPYFLNEPEPGTPEADRFAILLGLIQGYEAQHWPVEQANEETDDAKARLIARMKVREKRMMGIVRSYGRRGKMNRFVRVPGRPAHKERA